VGTYIAIDGTIATGKTTLAKAIASIDRRFTPILENFRGHPFLKSFYRDPEAHSFETELCFSLIHYHSLKRLDSNSLSVSDFYFPKDYVYASLTMRKNDKKLFTILYREIGKRLQQPDLLIRLTAPVEVLMKRIQSRGRKMENSISGDYVRKIAARERQTYRGVKVLEIDSSIIDFRHPDIVRDKLIPKIISLLPS
jgi:deoxyguanosine kinase